MLVMTNKSKIIHRRLLISGAGKAAYPQDVFFLNNAVFTQNSLR
jgi:hypothetical protein